MRSALNPFACFNSVITGVNSMMGATGDENRLLINSEQSTVATAQKIVWQLPSEFVSAGEQQKIMELLVGLMMSKLPQFSILEIRKMVEPMLSDIKKSRAYQEIAEEGAREEQ